MVVGVLVVDLIIHGANSLKDKRRVLLSLKEKVRNKFNVAVAEVDDNDLWQKSSVGITTVSNDQKHVNQVLSKLVDYIEDRFDVEISDYNIEIL